MKKLSLLLGICLVALTAFIAPNSTKQAQFESFMAELPAVEFPFQIGIEDMTNRYEVYQTMSDEELEMRYRKMEEFRDFLPETWIRFSRLGPPLVEPLAKMQVSEDVVGIVYTTFRDRRFRGENAFLIMLFDRQGKPIDHSKNATKKNKKRNWFPANKPDILGYSLAYHGLVNTQTVRLEEDGRISLEIFENVWAKDIDEHGTWENEITGYKAVSTEELFINSKGQIKKLSNSKLVKSARASIH
ncbi:MAG: hypothetical protein F6K19_19570 [Cyanothece sp. SIO1E1]|nr:hypothetical protein [Cyanothece sp. SIO1E1]